MNLSYINDMPIWAELLVLLIGILFLEIALKGYKSGISRGPWYLLSYRFHRDKNPIAFWFFLALWLGIGLALVIFAIILLIPL